MDSEEQRGKSSGESGSEQSQAWIPKEEEPWAQRSDEPAPIHEQSEHGLEGAQTPESEAAHAGSESGEPQTEERQAGTGEQETQQQDERGRVEGQSGEEPAA